MRIKDSFRNFFGLDDDMEAADGSTPSYGYESENAHKPQIQPVKGKVIPMSRRTNTQKTSIRIIEPRVYSESERIADYLLNNESILLNFRRMDAEQAEKVIDFFAGAVYAINGDMKQVGEGIFLCTPQDVEISQMEADETLENYYY